METGFFAIVCDRLRSYGNQPLVALKGFAIVPNTRQAAHGSTTTGQAKHVGIVMARYQGQNEKGPPFVMN